MEELESKPQTILKDEGWGFFGGGFSVLHSFWPASALARMGRVPGFIQAVSSGVALAATFIQAEFNALTVQKSLAKIIREGPKVFKPLLDVIDVLGPTVEEFLLKRNKGGIGRVDALKLVMKLSQLEPLIEMVNRPALLQTHAALFSLLEDLGIDFSALVKQRGVEFQEISKNETLNRFSVWSTRNPEIRKNPELLKKAAVASMSLRPLFPSYDFTEVGERHSDGLTLRLGEFIHRGCKKIILFSTGCFTEHSKKNAGPQNLFESAIDDFHTDVNLYLMEELNYALSKGYTLVCNNKEAVLARVNEPSKISDPVNWRRKARKLKSDERKVIILITPTHKPPGLNLLRFPTDPSFVDTFVDYGIQAQEAAEKFLRETLDV